MCDCCGHMLRDIGFTFTTREKEEGKEYDVAKKVVAHYIYSSPLDEREPTWREEIKIVLRKPVRR